MSQLLSNIIDETCRPLPQATPPAAPRHGGVRGVVTRVRAAVLAKAVRAAAPRISAEAQTARAQGAVVNDSLMLFGRYNSAAGVQEKTNITFATMRALAHTVEPVAAIIETRIQQAAAFAEEAVFHRGRAKSPGWSIRMRDREQKPTPRDRDNIKLLSQYIAECGIAPPPSDETPEGWEPGFHNFLRMIVRDSLTLDWVAIRRWASAEMPQRYPVVAFAPMDAALVRRAAREVVAIKNGRRIIRPAQDGMQDRTHADGDIRFVKLNATASAIEEKYTGDEVSVAIRNRRTDEWANGYGYGELERLVNACTTWIYARNYNSSRFRQDSLPRGILSVMANINEQQLAAFQLQWRQTLQGVGNRWQIPIFRGTPQQGSSVSWQPLDVSSRDMEYHQFMFAVSLWAHSIYQIHPEETGWEALSPFRPPLSEASPEAKMESSQDKGLAPLLRWVAGIMNDLIRPLDPERRYVFEFLGLGQSNFADEEQLYTMMLQNGTITPGMLWDMLDQERPKALKDHPAWDLPMPFAQGLQYVDSLQQQAAGTQAQSGMGAPPPQGAPGSSPFTPASQREPGDREQDEEDEQEDAPEQMRKGLSEWV